MNYKVFSITPFDRQLKRLSKKYPSLRIEFKKLLESLESNPTQGIPLGNNCFKIRMSISSKGKGKSGGSRVITSVFVEDESVYLISIYDKSEKENLSDRELNDLLKFIDK